MVEHDPCSVFSWDSLSGSEDEATSPPPYRRSPFPLAKMGCKNERLCRISVTREGLQGTGAWRVRKPRRALETSSSVFSRNPFWAVRAKLLRCKRNRRCDANHGYLRPFFSQSCISEAVNERLLRKTRSQQCGRLQVRPLSGSATVQWRNIIPFVVFSSESISRAVRTRLLLVMHASAMVRIHKPRSVFSLVILLRAVSWQLLRTEMSAVQSRLRFGA